MLYLSFQYFFTNNKLLEVGEDDKEYSNELYDLISRCQKNENDAFEIMILKFQPLLKKYAFLLNYGDAYSEMYENFVECVYRIPLYQLHEPKNDSVILAYIKTAMKNSYIGLSKNNSQYKKQIPLEEMGPVLKRGITTINKI